MNLYVGLGQNILGTTIKPVNHCQDVGSSGLRNVTAVILIG